jgi:hypothetical protein
MAVLILGLLNKPLKYIHRSLLNNKITAYTVYMVILHFTFLFSLFVFVSAAGHYFCIWTGQVPALF